MARIKTNVADLLQMIADKQPPRTILYSGYVWQLYETDDYYCKDKGCYLFDWFYDVHTPAKTRAKAIDDGIPHRCDSL